MLGLRRGLGREHTELSGEVVEGQPDGVARARDLDGLQHTRAAQLLSHLGRVEDIGRRLAVGLEAAHEGAVRVVEQLDQLRQLRLEVLQHTLEPAAASTAAAAATSAAAAAAAAGSRQPAAALPPPAAPACDCRSAARVPDPLATGQCVCSC